MIDSKNQSSLFAKLTAVTLIAFAAVCVCLVSSSAAPIKTGEQKSGKLNKTNEPVFSSAKYAQDANALSALVVKSDPEDPESRPIIVLVARIQAQVIMPGTAVAQEADVVAYMYLDEKDLTTFPSALKVVENSVIDGYPIDVNSSARGLAQLRRVYRRAVASGTNELDLSIEKE